MTFIKEKH